MSALTALVSWKSGVTVLCCTVMSSGGNMAKYVVALCGAWAVIFLIACHLIVLESPSPVLVFALVVADAVNVASSVGYFVAYFEVRDGT
jgi:hypothetical protein